MAKAAKKPETQAQEAEPQSAPETLHNDPDAMRSALAERIKSQAIFLRDSEVSKRSHWAAIGADLLIARESSLSNQDFGAWILASGISKMPGLDTAAARSDVIWLAEYPDRAAKIGEETSGPRHIRQKWRALFASSCQVEADALAILDSVDDPDIEAAADGVAEKTGCTQVDAFAEIKRLIEIAQDEGEPDIAASVAKALPKLKKALQAAADAGITHDMLCTNAGGVWGGFFAWSHQPPPSTMAEALHLAKALANDEGVSFKDFISAAGEVFTE
jgi:hypothetical protein